MRHEINRLAELSDKKRERAFSENETRQELQTSRNIIIIFSIINLLFVIWDYLYLKYSSIAIIIYHSLIPRILILIMAIIVSTLLKKLENKIMAMNSVIIFAILMYLLHEYIALHFAPVDPIFEVLDLVFITFGVFIIPNRWITNVCTSAFLIAIFVVLTPFTIPTLEGWTKALIAFYLFSQLLIVALPLIVVSLKL